MYIFFFFFIQLLDKFESPEIIEILQEKFPTHELLVLDYHPDRGSHIDKHVDDIWAWGPSIININLLSKTVLTLENDEFILPIHLNSRDLLLLRDDPRNVWTHEIKEEHITDQRYCLTLRSFSSQVQEKFPEICSKFDPISYF